MYILIDFKNEINVRRIYKVNIKTFIHKWNDQKMVKWEFKMVIDNV